MELSGPQAEGPWLAGSEAAQGLRPAQRLGPFAYGLCGLFPCSRKLPKHFAQVIGPETWPTEVAQVIGPKNWAREWAYGIDSRYW